jgi:hypothetical protein
MGLDLWQSIGAVSGWGRWGPQRVCVGLSALGLWWDLDLGLQPRL